MNEYLIQCPYCELEISIQMSRHNVPQNGFVHHECDCCKNKIVVEVDWTPTMRTFMDSSFDKEAFRKKQIEALADQDIPGYVDGYPNIKKDKE